MNVSRYHKYGDRSDADGLKINGALYPTSTLEFVNFANWLLCHIFGEKFQLLHLLNTEILIHFSDLTYFGLYDYNSI